MSDYRDLNIKPVYDSNDDILDFYNSTLETTHIYKRASGYFSHGLFKYISKGLLGLVKNKGKMFLVISNEIDKETFNKIKEGYTSYYDNDYLNNLDLTKLEENISDLAFLISIGLVKIKIAYSIGIYHEKYGLLLDGSGNKILFSGSNNETQAAIKNNFESFETTINWDCSKRDLEKIRRREETFDKLWNNSMDNLSVMDIPEALYKEILKKNDPSKTIKKIPDMSIYIDYNDNLTIDYNFDFDSSAWFLCKRWKDAGMIKSESNNKLIFNTRISYVDIQFIVKSFKKYMSNKNINVLISEQAINIFKNHVLNLKQLAIKGKKIKKDKYSESVEFIEFKEEQNKILKRPLRKAQLIASKHIVDLKRTMNFSVPGSGKTATVLGAFEYLKNRGLVDKLLVIGPKNCFKSWRDEIELVLDYKKNEVLELNSSPNFDDKRIELKYNYNSSTFIMVNFEGTIHASSIIAQYIDNRVMVVFDEIHRIKKLEGEYYKGALEIVQPCPYRVALTGTPLPNGYSDLHNQFEILYDEYAKTYFGFNIENLKHKDQNFKKNKQLSSEVKIKMYPFYIRVTKKDLNVPKPEPDRIIKIYENSDLVSGFEYVDSQKQAILGKIISKLQLSIIPEVVLPDVIFNKKDFESEKIKQIRVLIDEIMKRNESVIVWTNFVGSLLKLKKHYSDLYPTEVIYGETKQEVRDKIVDDFNNGNIRVLITNPHTLAESVSLHKKCNNAIYAEINYNLTHFLQSRDRIHRLGIEDDRKTNYYIIQSYFDDESIDSIIYDVLQEKKLRMTDSIDSPFLEKLLNEEIVQDLEKRYGR